MDTTQWTKQTGVGWIGQVSDTTQKRSDNLPKGK